MANTFVYVANTESRELLVFRMDSNTGDLVLIEHVLGGRFNALAISPDKRFLFASLRDEPFGIASFTIDAASGTLKPLGEGRLPGPLAYVCVDRSGRWLLGASYHENFVSVSAIDAMGVVRDPHQVVRGIDKAHAILAAPDNRHVLATSLGGDFVARWSFDVERGEIIEHDRRETKVLAGAGPRHLRFHPNGRSVVLVNELDGTLVTFDYDADSGVLDARGSTSILKTGFKGKPWAADVHFGAEGQFVYASERTSSTIAALELDASGALHLIDHTPTERQPRGLAVDPSGRYVLAVGQKSNRMTVYSIAANGALQKLREHAVGADPIWIEMLAV